MRYTNPRTHSISYTAMGAVLAGNIVTVQPGTASCSSRSSSSSSSRGGASKRRSSVDTCNGVSVRATVHDLLKRSFARRSSSKIFATTPQQTAAAPSSLAVDISTLRKAVCYYSSCRNSARTEHTVNLLNCTPDCDAITNLKQMLISCSMFCRVGLIKIRCSQPGINDISGRGRAKNKYTQSDSTGAARI